MFQAVETFDYSYRKPNSRVAAKESFIESIALLRTVADERQFSINKRIYHGDAEARRISRWLSDDSFL